MINLFDPALIILSGERMRYDYLYAAETLAEMDNLVINSGQAQTADRDTCLGRSALGARGGCTGAVGGKRGDTGRVGPAKSDFVIAAC